MNLPVATKQNQEVAAHLAMQKKHDLSIIEQVVMQGDLSKLTAEQRVTYYHAICESIGLNPLTRPFDYITLNGKLTLYAKKDCTEQLRQVKGISITGLEEKMVGDVFIVKAKAKARDGRTDESTGAVACGNLKGDALANAIMKAETKAKRRVTLSIGGLGWVDESEIESIPNAKPAVVDIETGEIKDIKCVPQIIQQPPVNQPVTNNQPPVEPPKEENVMPDGCGVFVNKCFTEHGKLIFDYVLATSLKANMTETKIWISAFNNQEIFFERFNKWKETNTPKQVAPRSMDELVFE